MSEAVGQAPGQEPNQTSGQGQMQGQARDETTPVYIADGRYRMIARVGVGGTAIVYRCVDEHTSRIVAVKVMRATNAPVQEAAKRFHREARLAASLSHRHIIRVLDFGYSPAPLPPRPVPWTTDDDQPVPYVAMEYIFGPNLKDVVRRGGPLPFRWVYQLGDQLCNALGAAHAQGVVHRDVKPQNVMLVDSAAELLAKLGDFGIARQEGGDYTTLTMTGQVLGTPDYLAPEQVVGEPGGQQSDLYSLGIVLFELLTGRLPFEADNPLAAASRRMVEEPPRPSAFRPEIPPDLEDVVMWTLRREPSERPAGVADLAKALRWSRQRGPEWEEADQRAWLALAPPSRPLQVARAKITRPLPSPAAEPPV